MSGDTELEVRYLKQSVETLSDKLDKIDQKQVKILHSVHKKKHKGPKEDENPERGNWSGQIEFLLSCLGYAVGLGNVWRFPYLCYRNGGGAFLIPYCIMLGIVGIPIFFLELSLGQFSSSGPATSFRFASLFSGIGMGMVVVSALVAVYYNMIIGWSIYYLFASFTSTLPWATCGDWSTPYCRDRLPLLGTSNCTNMNYTVTNNGTCLDVNGTLKALYNESLAKTTMNIKRIMPSEDYLNEVALGKNASPGIEDLGSIQWQLVLCLLLAWVFVALALSKGIKSSGKVVYFTATFPYIVLVILLIRGLMEEGHYEGIKFYITPDLSKLSNARVWKDAAVQIFFSLSASWGGLIALSSYNKFHTDTFRDTMIVSFGNCLTSVFAGFVIFSYLGILAHDLGQDVADVVEKGPALTFIVYPYAVTKLPISPLWSILFFFMLITLGVDSQFVLVETVTTSITDKFPKTRKFKTFVVICCCCVFFLLGLPLTTNGGQYLLDLMDNYSSGWNVLVISILECVAVAYVYGVRRFLNDIECMTGVKVCGCIPWVLVKYWWAICWCCLTPLASAFILVFSLVDYEPIKGYPLWAEAIGWILTLVVVVSIFIPGIVLMCKTPGTFRERIRILTTPTRDWGPALVKHRQIVAKYGYPDFVVNPKDYGNVPDMETGNFDDMNQNNETTYEKQSYDQKM